jgi:hypothetical protein
MDFCEILYWRVLLKCVTKIQVWLKLDKVLGTSCGDLSTFIIFFPMAQQPLGGLGLIFFPFFLWSHFRHTTLGRTPLDEWPARRRDLYLTTQHSEEKDIHAPGGIQTHNPSKWVVVDPHLRQCSHWDWHVYDDILLNSSWNGKSFR